MDVTAKKGDLDIFQLKLKILEHNAVSYSQIFAILLPHRVVQLFLFRFSYLRFWITMIVHELPGSTI